MLTLRMIQFNDFINYFSWSGSCFHVMLDMGNAPYWCDTSNQSLFMEWRTDSTEIQMYVFLYRTMWTWESWCSHCAISPRLAGSPSPWSKPEISKPWTSLELQVGADWMQRFHKGVVWLIMHMKSVSCFVVGFCFVASRANTLLHPNWTRHMLSFSRSVCESVSDVWRPEAKEEEDINQAQHFEPSVQWSHCVWCSSWEHWPDQPAHSCHGLWSVSKLPTGLQYISFIYSTLTSSTFWFLLFVPQGWT